MNTKSAGGAVYCWLMGGNHCSAGSSGKPNRHAYQIFFTKIHAICSKVRT